MKQIIHTVFDFSFSYNPLTIAKQTWPEVKFSPLASDDYKAAVIEAFLGQVFRYVPSCCTG